MQELTVVKAVKTLMEVMLQMVLMLNWTTLNMLTSKELDSGIKIPTMMMTMAGKMVTVAMQVATAVPVAMPAPAALPAP